MWSLILLELFTGLQSLEDASSFEGQGGWLSIRLLGRDLLKKVLQHLGLLSSSLLECSVWTVELLHEGPMLEFRAESPTSTCMSAYSALCAIKGSAGEIGREEDWFNSSLDSLST